MANVEAEVLSSLLRGTKQDKKVFETSGVTLDHFQHLPHVAQFCFEQFERNHKWPAMETVRELFPDFRPARAVEPLRFYLERLRERSAYNALSVVLHRTNKMIDETEYTPGKVYEALSFARENLLSIRDQSAIQSPDLDWSDLLDGRAQNFGKKKKEVKEAVIETPWKSLNDLIIGWMRGQLATIIARTGLGKTWILMLIAYHAFRRGNRVLVVSNEMPAPLLLDRLDAIAARLNWNHFRNGNLSPDQLSRYRRTAKRIKRMKGALRITEDSSLRGMSIASLSAKVSEFDPDIILIDGAYLMDGGNDKDVVRNLLFLSRGLQRLARSRNQRILQVHQVNRSGEGKKTGGGLGAVSWSDAVSHDSAVIMEIVGDRDAPTRVCRLVKGRDSGPGSFVINFRLDPEVDFSENTNPSFFVDVEAPPGADDDS